MAAAKGNTTTNLNINPQYEEHIALDQVLLGWLFGSMEQSVASDVVNHTTSREVWKALEERYGSANRARITQLKATLQNTRKGTMKMMEYLALMKQASNNLALAGESITESALITNVLIGLDAEYLPITCQLNCKNALNWQETHATLTAFEQTLIQLNVIPQNSEVGSLTANAVFGRLNFSQGNSNGSNNFNQKNQNVMENRWQNKGYYLNYSRGGADHSNNNRNNFRGRGGRKNNSKIICQICGKRGHSATICWCRLDEEHMGASPNNGGQMAYIASPEIIGDPTWYEDSGASSHVTYDQNMMNRKEEYNGQAHGQSAPTRET